MGVQSISNSISESERVERLNRALNLIGDPLQRWNDRLVLEGCSKVKEYRSGRMALVLDCKVPVREKPDPAGLVHDVRSFLRNQVTFIVLKADTVESKKLQQWDEKLMLVSNVHIVESPEGVIPSRVGFYTVENEIVDRTGDLLLFQSAINGVYKRLPRIKNWEPRPVGRTADESVVENIQSTPQVVKCVSDNQRRSVEGKWRWLNVDAKVIAACLNVFINADSVEIGIKESGNGGVNVVDVLLGPLNLEA